MSLRRFGFETNDKDGCNGAVLDNFRWNYLFNFSFFLANIFLLEFK